MIKRYTQPVVQTTPEPGFHIEEVPLFEDAKGKFVLHSDYAALEARCRELEADHDKLVERSVGAMAIADGAEGYGEGDG